MEEGLVDFQYRMFYPFNDRIGADPGLFDQDGDWEHVTVRVQGTEILGVFLSAHDPPEPQWRGTRAFQFVPGAGFEHPVVYSARRSHAAYESAGEQVRDGFLPNDYTNDSGPWWELWDHPVEIDDRTRWAFFRGSGARKASRPAHRG